MHPMLRGILPIVLATVMVWVVATASAETTSCQFVAGFADLAHPVGRTIVGDCIEDERSLTSQEAIAFTNGEHIWVMAGTTIQRTTRGVFTWTPSDNQIGFMDGQHVFLLTEAGVAREDWRTPGREPPAVVGPTPTPPSTRPTTICRGDVCSSR